MSVHFRADESGRVLPTHAEAVLEVTEEYTVKVPVASKPEPAAAKPAAAAGRPDRADNILADDDDFNTDDSSLTQVQLCQRLGLQGEGGEAMLFLVMPSSAYKASMAKRTGLQGAGLEPAACVLGQHLSAA